MGGRGEKRVFVVSSSFFLSDQTLKNQIDMRMKWTIDARWTYEE